MSIFIHGKKCSLRTLRPEDVNYRYLEWLNDPEVNNYSRRACWPMTWETLRGYYNSIQKNQLILAIIYQDEHIGNIMLDKIDWVHRKAELSILIGEKKCWKSGIGTEAWMLMERHAFLKLNLNRLAAGSVNPSMMRILEKLNWQSEGVFRQAFFMEGTYVNEYRYGILREEWLKIREISMRQ